MNGESDISIRDRTRPYIPSLDYRRNIIPDSGNFDKVQVSYTPVRLASNANSSSQLDRVIREATICSRHFTGNIRGVTARKTAAAGQPSGSSRKTLLSGTKLTFNTAQFPQNRVSASIRLCFNPTRYRAFYLFEAATTEGVLREDSLLRSDLLFLTRHERFLTLGSLNNSSNVIPPVSSAEQQFFAGISCFANVLETAQSVVEREISHAGQLRLEEAWSDWVVQNLEVYWEFACENALVEVEEFARRFRMVDNRNPEINISPQSDRIENALYYHIQLSYDNRLIVYAKRADRIRFEIKLNQSLWSMIRSHGLVYEFSDLGSSPPSGNDGLVNCVSAYREWAAYQLTTIFRSIRPTLDSAAPSMVKVLELARGIDAAVLQDNTSNGTQLAEQIWMLFANGGYIDAVTNPRFNDTLVRLLVAGFLESVHQDGNRGRARTVRYYLASPYRESLGHFLSI